MADSYSNSVNNTKEEKELESDTDPEFDFFFDVNDDEYEQIMDRLREGDDEVVFSAKKPRVPCPFCQRTFGRKAELPRHLNAKHNPNYIPVDKTQICQVCGLNIKSNMKVHLRLHTGEKPYVCKLCSAAFRTKARLQKHELVHKGDLFECGICFSSMKTKQLLEAHMDKHEKGLIKNGPRYRHSRDRTKAEVPTKNICGICNFEFRSEEYLLKHEKTHLKPIQCTICHRSFSQKASWYRHRKTKHAELL